MSAALVSHPLRPYQAEGIARVRQAYRAGKRAILVVAPTGSGKTKVGSEFAITAVRKGGRVLWLAHREELLKQARERILAEGVERVGIVAPWASPDRDAPVQVASVQTLAAMRAKGKLLPRATIMIADEAHHFSSAAREWFDVASCYRDIPILGLTATPERADGSPMGDLFDHLEPISSVSELQDLGVLVPVLTFRPAWRTKTLSAEPCEAYLQRCPGERAFVFCATVAHAEAVAKSFRDAGVHAATIHADTSWELRRARLESFRTQSVEPLKKARSIEAVPLVLCNVYALTEGVDVPEASCVILARGCGAAGTFIQMVGRGARCAPGKTRMVLIDLRGVSHDHGLFEADRDYSLDGKAITVTKSDAKEKTCIKCGCEFVRWLVNYETGEQWCPHCREPGPPLADPGAVDPRELVEAGPLASPETKHRELHRIAQECVKLDHRAGWIGFEYRRKFGKWPDDDVQQLLSAYAAKAS